MTLNVSGPISLGGKTTGQSIELELNSTYGTGGFAKISMNDNAARNLAQKSSGIIKMSDFYGKSAIVSVSLTISSNTTNYILKNNVGSGYVAGKSNITLTINSGVYLYSTSTSTPALTISGFTAGDIITVINNGVIMGMGGQGGDCGQAASGGYFIGNFQYGSGGNGYPGGPALSTNFTITLKNNGIIGGGGGGGGGGNGFSGGKSYAAGSTGGGGRPNGPVGANPWLATDGTYPTGNGTAGTLTSPGSGWIDTDPYNPVGSSGAGGNLGAAGQGGEGRTDGAGAGHTPSLGGAAGAAIQGNSYITYNPRGSLLGGVT